MNLDREDFRQWLVSKEPDELVGLPGISTNCPGTWWLASEGIEAEVETTHVWIGCDALSSLSWLARFAAALDLTHHEHEGFQSLASCHNITAKEALTILDSLDT